LAKLRAELLKYNFNLSKAFESLAADPKPVYLKNKRKSYGHRYQINYKTTENIEFLKEVIITFNLLMFYLYYNKVINYYCR